ncbi:jg13041, partial [Pararge aegeria aegeria]
VSSSLKSSGDFVQSYWLICISLFLGSAASLRSGGLAALDRNTAMLQCCYAAEMSMAIPTFPGSLSQKKLYYGLAWKALRVMP